MRKLVIVIVLLIPILCFSNSDIEFLLTLNSIKYFSFSNYLEANQYSVNVKLNDDYTNRFEQVTSENIGKELSVVLGTQILVTAQIQCKIPSGYFSISNFNSPEESKEFMQKLLKEQYSSKLYKSNPEDYEPKLSYKDSLYLQISMDYINFDFQAANSKLIELTNIINNDSDDYYKVLIDYLFLSLRANDFTKAQEYYNMLTSLIVSNNLEGLKFYKKVGVLAILILIGNNKLDEAQNLKVEFEESIDFPKIFEALKKLPYSHSGVMNNEKQQEMDEISNALDVLGSLPYYSYICYKFSENEKAIKSITEFINATYGGKQMKENSHYLLKLMYLYANESYKEALSLSESTLQIDAKSFKYDTIQSKLWHSLILSKSNKAEEALNYYLEAQTEFNNLENPKGLTLKFLLTPFVGVSPDESIYQDFDKIVSLSKE